MSKRKASDSEYVEIPQDVWFLITGHLAWHDVATLLNFIAVSQTSIRFVQPLIRMLVDELLDDTSKYDDSGLGYRLTKCLLVYQSAKTGTLRQWREWSATILSAIHLIDLQDRHRCAIFNEGSSITSNTKLSDIYYFGADGKPARRLDSMRITHTVCGMREHNDNLLIAEAKAVIKCTRPESEQEVYLHALDTSIYHNSGRALSYYALAKGLEVRPALGTDCFKNVVLVNPRIEGDFLHIYSTYSQFVKEFIQRCVSYEGKPEHATIALHLYRHKKEHDKVCERQCRKVIRSIKETDGA